MHDYKKILSQVLEEVLENLAFVFSVPEDTGDAMQYEMALAAKISFTGLFSGTIVLGFSEQILPEIARNMLGVDEEILVVHQHDAFKEVLNVICGNLLPAIAGEKEVFTISVPCIISREEMTESVRCCPPTSMATLELDNGQVLLFLLIDGEKKSTV